MSQPDAADVQATIVRLIVYPIKSCAGIELRESVLAPTGLDLDRAWMVVDADGEFVSQRELPRMALIRPQLRHYDVILKAPGMLALHLQIDAVEQPMKVRVWDDVVPAWDMGDVAAQWFSDFLGRRLRLVRFDPDHQRLSDPKWTGGVQAPNQFSDGYPLLVTTDSAIAELNQKLAQDPRAAAGLPAGGASILRFRPNIVLSGLPAHDEDNIDELRIDTPQGPVRLKLVKPCARCPVPNVDPDTAEVHPIISDTLQTYRSDARVGGAVTFGMNAIIIEGTDATLATGQGVWGRYRF